MIRFFTGLDLGQAQDYTALAILDRHQEPTGKKYADLAPEMVNHYQLRHLKRYKLGTPYPTVVEKVTEMMGDETLAGRTALVADATGVGRPVIDLLRKAGLKPVPVIIHGGDQFTPDPKTGYYRVPKRELVSTTKVLFQEERLKFADSLPDVKTLIDELLRFEVKITDSGHDTYGAWREGAHDDMVFALALACWWAEQIAKREVLSHKHALQFIPFRVERPD